MPTILLPHTQDSVELGELLAVCHELTLSWRGSALSAALPMPVYGAHLTLANVLKRHPEYAYSFDVACRVVASQPDTMNATTVFFNDSGNAQWFKRLPFKNGLQVKSGSRREVLCAHFTEDCMEYWQSLTTKERVRVQIDAQSRLGRLGLLVEAIDQIVLPHTREAVELDLLLAVCNELTIEWRDSPLSADLPMPVYASKLLLANRLNANPEYAYSFDIACRLVSSQRDTMSATNVFFDNVCNAKWFKKVYFENGLAVQGSNRREVFCAEFTKDCIERWNRLPAEKREQVLASAQVLLKSLPRRQC